MPAYSCTIHKIQGQTLASVIIDFKGCFESGQVYAALSRVKEMDNMRIFNLDSIKSFLNTNQEVDYIYNMQWGRYVEIMIDMDKTEG